MVPPAEEEQPVEEIAQEQEKPTKEGFFARLKRSLLKTKENLGSGFISLFRGKKIDDDLFEELEEQLLIALTPDLKLFNRCCTESIARRQHHRFTLLLKLTRQLTNRRGFTHTVDAHHQDHERRFTFNIQRLIDFRQNLAHLFFQQAIERLGITKLLAGCAFRQIGDNFTCGFHAHIGDQQLFFQLFKQIIVDFFTAEQADKSGTEIFFNIFRSGVSATIFR